MRLPCRNRFPNSVVFQRHFVVFAERVADPVFGAEDAAEVRVADEVHAEEVEDLALVPVGGAPDVADGGHFGQLAWPGRSSSGAGSP